MKRFNHSISLNFEVDSDNENLTESEVYEALKTRFNDIKKDEVLGNVEIYNCEEND